MDIYHKLDCKNLAPTWESLAKDFALEKNVVVAKVDAEAENSKATAKDQGIAGYPTIKFFPKGSTEPEDYQGARSEEAFVDFLNSKTGTNRLVGGGLNTEAGTIPSLDELISKYITTKSFDDLKSEIKQAAENLKDKYAQYYVKVADKISQSENYASKELSRLQKILGKGGSAPEKLDDLVSRANILRRFVFAGEDKEQADESKDEL